MLKQKFGYIYDENIIVVKMTIPIGDRPFLLLLSKF